MLTRLLNHHPRLSVVMALFLALAAAWLLKPGPGALLGSQALAYADEQDGPVRSDSVVKIEGKVSPEKPGTDRKQVVTVTLTINKGWHVYANPVGLEDLKSVETVVSVTAKKKLEDTKIAYADGHEIKDPTLGKYSVYDGKATITATVNRAPDDDSPLEVKIKFQACNDRQCLLPATKTLTLP